MIKVRKYSVNSSSTYGEMYNIFDIAQKQRLVLKSYIPGINSFIYPNIHNK